MTDLYTFKQNINSLSIATKLSILGLIFSIYLLGLTDSIIPIAAVLIILFLIIVKINDNMIQIIADGAVFLAGSMTLLSLYGAAIAFNRTNFVYSESYSYPLIFAVFFVSFYLFFVSINKIKENMKNKTDLKKEQRSIGLTFLFCILMILSAAAIYIFENPLFLPKFIAFFMLGIAIPVFVFYIMYVLLFWKIIPGVKSVIWLPYLLFAVDILTLWISLTHPIGKYFPNIDLTFISVHANDFYEIIIAGIVVSFLFMAGIFLLSKLFSILQKFIQNQNSYIHFKKTLGEQRPVIKISFYGLLAIIFFAVTNPFVSIFRDRHILSNGQINNFVTGSFGTKMSLLQYEYDIYLPILLLGLFIGVFIFLGEQILKKQKIRFNFNLFPILFYSLISFSIIFLLLLADVFMFIPLMNPDPYYDDPPILFMTICQIVFLIIYWYKIRKMNFKPTDILIAAGFFILMMFFTFVVTMTTGSFLGPLYKVGPPIHYIAIKIISFILSIFIFEIGSKIINKFNEE